MTHHSFWLKGFVLFAGALLWLLPAGASAGGLFEDFAELSSFILSSQRQSVSATVVRTEDDERAASLYVLHAVYPLKSSFLIKFEQPFVTVCSDKGIESGFGDIRLRIRAKMVSHSGMSFSLLYGLRTGSGSRLVFPFASGSIDTEIGAAVDVVDTLSSFSFWSAVTVASVWRGPEGLDEATAHGNYLTFSVGIVIPISADFDAHFISAGYFLTSGATREIYIMQALYNPSPFIQFFGSLQAEGGVQEERVNDFAALAGMRIFY